MGLDKKTIAMAKEPNYATLTTLFKSGAPQTHVMWVDTEGENILINTEIPVSYTHLTLPTSQYV